MDNKTKTILSVIIFSINLAWSITGIIISDFTFALPYLSLTICYLLLILSNYYQNK